MKIIKSNLYLIIAGVVALLAIGGYFWPLGSWFVELQGGMTSRIAMVNAVQLLIKNKIEMPGGVVLTGPVQPNISTARDVMQRDMKGQADSIATLAADQNQSGRVVVRNGRSIPLLGTQEQNGFLPKIEVTRADPHDFKDAYSRITEMWPIQLAGTDKMAAAAPTSAEVTQAHQDKLAADAARAPIIGGQAAPGFVGANAPDAAQVEKFAKDYISSRAAGIRMYVTLDAFDREAWVNGSAAPDERQIFEALVRYWLIQDVVNAIDAVNHDAAGKPTKDVGQSWIKRLEKVHVGGSGLNEAGGLFIMGSTPVKGQTAASFDVNQSMTGRIGSASPTALYDVSQVNITMVMNPAKLNAFIAQLYHQNNGYTVLNIKQTTVDPFQAASDGYLFGETQCVRVEIQVEALLFRKWTTPIMPDSIRNNLGVPLTPAK